VAGQFDRQGPVPAQGELSTRSLGCASTVDPITLLLRVHKPSHCLQQDTTALDHGLLLGQAGRMNGAADLASVLSTFEEPCAPRTVALLNDYDVRVVKTKGEFTRHSHPDTDEFFLVLHGALTIRMDGGDVELGPGQVYVVPRGVPHQPVSIEGAEVLLIEPSATVNTGDTPSELTAERRVL